MSSLDSPFIGLNDLKNRFGLLSFVETGCHTGDGLRIAQALGFRELHSCDVNPIYSKRCREQFPDAVIFEGTSRRFLERMAPAIDAKTAFWLDAHYPVDYGFSSETESEKFPLLDELLLIRCLKRGYERDVIICDDIRIIADPANARYRPGELRQDQYDRKTTVAGLIDSLSSTHTAVLREEAEGVLIFTPAGA